MSLQPVFWRTGAQPCAAPCAPCLTPTVSLSCVSQTALNVTLCGWNDFLYLSPGQVNPPRRFRRWTLSGSRANCWIQGNEPGCAHVGELTGNFCGLAYNDLGGLRMNTFVDTFSGDSLYPEALCHPTPLALCSYTQDSVWYGACGVTVAPAQGDIVYQNSEVFTASPSATTLGPAWDTHATRTVTQDCVTRTYPNGCTSLNRAVFGALVETLLDEDTMQDAFARHSKTQGQDCRTVETPRQDFTCQLYQDCAYSLACGSLVAGLSYEARVILQQRPVTASGAPDGPWVVAGDDRHLFVAESETEVLGPFALPVLYGQEIQILEVTLLYHETP